MGGGGKPIRGRNPNPKKKKFALMRRIDVNLYVDNVVYLN